MIPINICKIKMKNHSKKKKNGLGNFDPSP